MSFDSEQTERYISIWSKAVETQMHFNEMSVKSRQLGLTFVAAALGVAVVLLGRGDDFSLPVSVSCFRFQIHISVVLLIGAMFAIVAVRGLDLKVYHKMLRGAVAFGEDFEENYMKNIFELNKGMTQAISHFSRFDDASVDAAQNGKYQYTGKIKITAEDKIKAFYTKTIRFLLISALGLFVITNLNIWLEKPVLIYSEDSAPSLQDVHSESQKELNSNITDANSTSENGKNEKSSE